MAQRELKVKVTPEISASFKKLLNMLGKTQTLNIRTNVTDGGLKKVTDRLNKLANKKVSVRINAESKNLDRLSKKIDDLKDKKVSIQADTNGLSGVGDELEKAKRKAEDLNRTKISPIGVASGLSPLINGLDAISNKVTEIAGMTIAPVFTEAIEASKELYDQQVSFQKQFQLDGVSNDQIGNWMKDLSGYAQKTIFDTDQLLSLFGNLQGAGFEDSMGLTKSLAGISSLAPNVSNALSSVSRQVKQFSKDGNVYTRDWNAIRDAIQGVAANKLNDWFKENRGIELVTDNFADGKVSVQDFLQAIREVGGSGALQKMATNTDTLSGSLAQFKETLRNTLIGDQYDPGPLRSVFDSIVKSVNEVTDMIPSISQDIGKGIGFLKDTFGEAFKNFTIKEFIDDLKASAQASAPAIKVFAKTLSMLTNSGSGIGNWVGSFVTLTTYVKAFSFFAKPLFNTVTALKSLFNVSKQLAGLKGGAGFLGKLFGSSKGSGSKGGSSGGAGSDMGKIKTQALNIAKNIATLAGVIGTVWAGAKAMESVSKMNIDFSSLMQNLGSVATGLLASGAYISAIGFAMSKISDLKQYLIEGSIALAGVAGVMVLVTKAVEEISSLKIDTSQLTTNLIATMLGLTASGAVMAGIGGAMMVFPSLLPALALGAGVMLAISAVLEDIASNFSDMSKHLLNLAKNIKKINAIDLPDSTEMTKKFETIEKVVSGMNKALGNGGFWKSLVNKFSSGFNADSAENLVSQITSIVELIQKINKTPKIDSGGIEDKIGEITKAMKALGKVKFDEFEGLPADSVAKATYAVKGIKTIGDVFKNLPKKLDYSSIETSIKGITNIFTNPFMTSYRNALQNMGAVDVDVETAKSIINSLTTVADVLRELPGDIDYKVTGDAIGEITEQVQKLGENGKGGYGFKQAIQNLGKGEIDVTGAVDLVNAINTIAGVLRELPGDIDYKVTGDAIGEITEQIKKLSEDGKGGYGFKKAIESLGKGDIDVTGAVDLVNSINTIAGVLRELPGDIDFTVTGDAISDITDTVRKLATSQSKDGLGFKQAIEELGKGKPDLEGATDLITAISTIANSLISIPAFDSAIVDTTISSITDSLNKLTAPDGIKSAIEKLTGDDLPTKIEQANTAISTISTLATTLNNIPEVEGVEEKMGAIARGIEEIAGIELNEDTLTTVDSIVAKVQNIITQLQLLTMNFSNIGTSYATSLVDGFGNKVGDLYTKFEEVKNKISDNADLTSIGKKMSDTLSSGFNADSLIQKINSIQTAIDNLKGKTVTITIKEVRQKAHDYKGGMVGYNYAGGQIPEYHSSGGRVGGRTPGKLSWFTGGRAHGRNTDTVPTMLTPGEYVLKRSVSNALGKGFLDALNNMNLSSAMAKLQNKVSGNNVTNNTYNNITQNVDNKASYLNGLGSIRRMVRL